MEDYKTGLYSQRELAKKFGISQGTVWRYIHGYTLANDPNKEEILRRERERRNTESGRLKKQQAGKAYYQLYREEILSHRKLFNATETGSAKLHEYNQTYYHKHKTILNQKSLTRYRNNKLLIDKIAITYGCRNKECRWLGEYLPAMLDF